MKVFYSSDYASSSGSIDTVKKSGWISKQIRREGGQLFAPTPLTAQDAKMIHDEQYIDDLFTVRSTSATTAAIGVWDASLLNSIKALEDPDLSSIPADQSLVTRERLIDLHMQTYRAMKRLFIQ